MARSTDTADRLRHAGLKVTGPRVAILAALEVDRTHPTAERIHEGLREGHPTLSLSTVYEALEAFIGVGLCRRVPALDGRLRVDGTVQDHDHAVCGLCGRIFDVERGPLRIPDPPRVLANGLTVRRVRIEYDVICSGCATGAVEDGAERAKKRNPNRRKRGPGAA